MDLFILLLIVMALCGAVQEATRDAIQQHLDPAAYAARRKQQRQRASVLLQGVCIVTILLLGGLFSF